MIYTAEFNGLGLIVFLIWFIASSLLQKNKKNNKDSIELDDKDENSNSFSMQDLRSLFDNSLNKLKTDSNFAMESDNNYDVDSENLDSDKVNENIDPTDFNQKEKKIDSENTNKIQFSTKQQGHSKSNINSIIGKKNKINVPKNLNRVFKSKNELRKAILLKEILDKPKALRK